MGFSEVTDLCHDYSATVPMLGRVDFAVAWISVRGISSVWVLDMALLG